MKINLNSWAREVNGLLQPPGCETVFVDAPSGANRCCTIGIIYEHRFAFYYWARFAHTNKSRPPILITIDSHNDVGGINDFDQKELCDLDLRDTTTLGLFAWLRLPRLNDGHILPSLYLNFFSDVYVLLNAKSYGEMKGKQYLQKDRYGDPHTVNFFIKEQELLNDLPLDRDIFLDIDLDYFSNPNPATGEARGTEVQWPANRISRFINNPDGIIQTVLPLVVGMTIALEPTYCGGLLNSQRALGLINQVLFNDTLCTDNPKWKK